MNNNIKTGTYVMFSNRTHLFLGYIDYKRRRCVIADKHGNKIQIWIEQLTNRRIA